MLFEVDLHLTCMISLGTLDGVLHNFFFPSELSLHDFLRVRNTPISNGYPSLSATSANLPQFLTVRLSLSTPPPPASILMVRPFVSVSTMYLHKGFFHYGHLDPACKDRNGKGRTALLQRDKINKKVTRDKDAMKINFSKEISNNCGNPDIIGWEQPVQRSNWRELK